MKNYGTHMNDLTEICTKVWEAKDVNAKRELLKTVVSSFKYKGKIQSFVISLNKITDCNKLDMIASNLILNKTDKVVELLPR